MLKYQLLSLQYKVIPVEVPCKKHNIKSFIKAWVPKTQLAWLSLLIAGRGLFISREIFS